MSIIINLALFIFGVFFTASAILKLTRHPHMVDELSDMGVPYKWGYASAVFEIISGPGLIIGIFFPLLAGISALAMVPVMIGAAIANFLGRNMQYGFGVIIVFLIPMIILSYIHLAEVRAFIGI